MKFCELEKMHKIYIDTTKRYEKSVRLVEVEAKKSKQKEIQIDKIQGDIDTVAALNTLLKRNQLNIKDISEIIPNTGPGSFTGIKIGVTVANIFNWATKRSNIKDLYKPNYGSKPNIQTKRPS